MDFSKNYYGILGVTNKSTESEIKKSYYKMSLTMHPDKGGNADEFAIISNAYEILSDKEKKEEYDRRSKWGKEYDEMTEYLDYEFSNLMKSWDEDKYKDFKKKESLNIVVYIDDSFNGSIEYERWVICKSCKGTGKDDKSKIEIKDKDGKVLRLFDSDGGCDFCEGTGKDPFGNVCSFCAGQGKIGSKECKTCKGEKRILGKQKLSNIDFPKGQKDLKIDMMGNFAKNNPGKVGHLWLVNKDTDNQ